MLTVPGGPIHVILVPNVVLLAGLWFYVKRKDRLQETEPAFSEHSS